MTKILEKAKKVYTFNELVNNRMFERAVPIFRRKLSQGFSERVIISFHGTDFGSKPVGFQVTKLTRLHNNPTNCLTCATEV